MTAWSAKAETPRWWCTGCPSWCSRRPPVSSSPPALEALPRVHGRRPLVAQFGRRHSGAGTTWPPVDRGSGRRRPPRPGQRGRPPRGRAASASAGADPVDDARGPSGRGLPPRCGREPRPRGARRDRARRCWRGLDNAYGTRPAGLLEDGAGDLHLVLRSVRCVAIAMWSGRAAPTGARGGPGPRSGGGTSGAAGAGTGGTVAAGGRWCSGPVLRDCTRMPASSMRGKDPGPQTACAFLHSQKPTCAGAQRTS